jgi:hypothetical protein
MIAAYHGKTDYSAAELLAVNPFAPAAQTAARLWECDRSASAPQDAAMPFKASLYASVTEDEESLSGQD